MMETCTRCGLYFERADGPTGPEHNGIHGPQLPIEMVVGRGDGTLDATLQGGRVVRLTEAEYLAWPR